MVSTTSNAAKGGNGLRDLIAGIWIVGTAAYFFIHFTMVFYAANESGIHSAIENVANITWFK